MNVMADVKVMKTAAETALAHVYAEARSRLPGDDAKIPEALEQVARDWVEPAAKLA